VASATTAGGLKREIHVELIPERLRALFVAPAQVLNAIRQANLQMPGGAVRQGGQLLSINTQGRFQSVAEIGEVIIVQRAGREIRVKDVARIKDWFQEQNRVIRNNGRSSVMLLVRKQSDANTLLVAKAVLEGRQDIERILPKGVKLDVLFAQSDMINRALGNVEQTSIQAFLLAFVVLFAFLVRLSPSIIVALAIPTSLLVTFPAMKATGVTLNIISMMGLALAIGMLVDNAIVVMENIFRHHQMGKSPRQAAVDGAQEVGMAITASTLTTLSVFLPILFVPGIVGALFKDMVVTICLSIAASLLVARTLIPMAASRTLALRGGWGTRILVILVVVAVLAVLAVTGRWAYLVTVVLLVALFKPLAWVMSWVMPHVINGYGALLRGCLRFRKTTLLVALAMFLGSSALLMTLGRDFLPKSDNGMVELELTGAAGNNLQFTEEQAKELEVLVKAAVPEATLYSVDIGSGEGIGAVFGRGEFAGRMRIKLPPLKKRFFGFGGAGGRQRTQEQIEEALRSKYRDIPGLEVRPFQFNITGSEGDIEVNLFVDDLVQARQLGRQVRDAMEKIPGLKDVKFSLEEASPELKVRLDRKRISQLGTNPGLVTHTISTYFMGGVAGVYQEGADEFKILVRVPPRVRNDVERLKNVPIFLTSGAMMPLAAVARLDEDLGPTQIDRMGQRRVVKITAVKGERALDALVSDVRASLEKMEWPEGVVWTIGGAAEDQRKSFGYLIWAIVAAMMLVYMVMASQFESLLEPFVILFSVPLAIVGVALGLFLTRTTLSLTAAIGLVMLAGIVVNNAIVLIDYLKQSWDGRWATLIDVTVEAGQVRLRPILMTTLTTVLAMLPMAMGIGEGAETWAPMARAVIGGLVSSMLLTLVVVPAWYVLIAGARARFRERRAARLAAREASAVD
jgi:HAE1 family hydrophobic/amphiphilic exporter-1